MVMDTLALAVSAIANYLLRNREAQRMLLPLIAFPVCGLGDLFCIYHELKAVQLRSLNRERAEMVAEHWLDQGRVSAAAASHPRGLGERPGNRAVQQVSCVFAHFLVRGTGGSHEPSRH